MMKKEKVEMKVKKEEMKVMKAAMTAPMKVKKEEMKVMKAAMMAPMRVKKEGMKVMIRKIKSLALVNVNQRTLHAGKLATNALTQSLEKKTEKLSLKLA